MNLHCIETQNFKLDGGAVFGIVPKSLWSKVYPADEKNLCNFAARCLLIETENKKILIDTGVGDKQPEKFFKYYFLNGEHTLFSSLSALGLEANDITDVVLTHLHFDHCGEAVKKNKEGELSVSFPNAKYWVSKAQWDMATTNPNPREKASFFKENILPIEESGKLKLIEKDEFIDQDIELKIFNGHTIGQLIPFINYKGKNIIYSADLIPTSAHLPLAWVCGYDTQPLLAMEEKEELLNEAVANNYIFLFEHDLYNECCTVEKTEKSFKPKKLFPLKEIL